MERDLSQRIAGWLAVGGFTVAALSIPLASAAGEPWLSAEGVNPWVVVFAGGLLAGLVAVPFGIEGALRTRIADRDRRWELSLLVWGTLAGAILVGCLIAGIGTATLGATLALIAAVEAAIATATIVAWLLAGG